MRIWIGKRGAILAVLLAAGCQRGTADAASQCDAPNPAAASASADAKFGACLAQKAYDARSVDVPIDSKAPGLIAQCDVEIDRAEGRTMPARENGSEQKRQAADQDAMRTAKAAILRYRGCPKS